jgi:hypothetical protein
VNSYDDDPEAWRADMLRTIRQLYVVGVVIALGSWVLVWERGWKMVPTCAWITFWLAVYPFVFVWWLPKFSRRLREQLSD